MSHDEKPVWRKVSKVEVGYNPGFGKSVFVGGSSLITLECGHYIVRKNSVKVPVKARCRDCLNLRNGSTRKSWDYAANMLTTETWDHKTGMPKVEIRKMTQAEMSDWNEPLNRKSVEPKEETK